MAQTKAKNEDDAWKWWEESSNPITSFLQRRTPPVGKIVAAICDGLSFTLNHVATRWKEKKL